MHKITWQPGEYGKGVVDQHDAVHAWNEDEYQLHHDYLEAHPHIQPQAYFYIEPNGAIDLTHPSPSYDAAEQVEAMHDLITPADPHFHPYERGSWSF